MCGGFGIEVLEKVGEGIGGEWTWVDFGGERFEEPIQLSEIIYPVSR